MFGNDVETRRGLQAPDGAKEAGMEHKSRRRAAAAGAACCSRYHRDEDPVPQPSREGRHLWMAQVSRGLRALQVAFGRCLPTLKYGARKPMAGSSVEEVAKFVLKSSSEKKYPRVEKSRALVGGTRPTGGVPVEYWPVQARTATRNPQRTFGQAISRSPLHLARTTTARS